MLKLKRVLDAKGIPTKTCAAVIQVSEKSAYNKIVGATDFTYKEACRLRGLLPEYNLDFLLSDETEAVTPTAPPVQEVTV